MKEYNLSQFELWNINNFKIKWVFRKLHFLSLCLVHASWGQGLDGLWLKSSTSRNLISSHLGYIPKSDQNEELSNSWKFESWKFWEYFLLNTAEHVAPKTKPVCSELQIPGPAAVLKESRCTCFAAECIWDVPVYFWQDLLPGSVSASRNRDEILQHNESVFYILAFSKNTLEWVDFAPLCFR